jgi:putative ABC transport system ATP-binding protein
MIKINNVSKIYGKDESVVNALDNVSYTFKDGLMTAIIGTSGSGKSTLLNVIGGLIKPTSGEVLFDDLNIGNMKDEKLSDFRLNNIGVVYQFFNLIPELSAKENIILPLMIAKKKIDDSYFNQLVTSLNIENRISHMPKQLSGGQQQRVAIARALINKPQVLLCDEPTGNLDSKSGEEVMSLLRKMQHEMGQTIIMVTHDSNIASQADAIVRIEDGRVSLDS